MIYPLAAPDKQAVFNDVFRIFRPVGHVAINDMAPKRQLFEILGRSLSAYVALKPGA